MNPLVTNFQKLEDAGIYNDIFRAIDDERVKEVIQKNMAAIWTRQRGQRFYVGEGGELKLARNFSERIRARRDADAVKKIYTETLKCISTKAIENKVTKEGDESLRNTFIKSFRAAISTVSGRIFDRTDAINSDVEGFFKGYLQRYCNSEELRKMHEVVAMQNSYRDRIMKLVMPSTAVAKEGEEKEHKIAIESKKIREEVMSQLRELPASNEFGTYQRIKVTFERILKEGGELSEDENDLLLLVTSALEMEKLNEDLLEVQLHELLRPGHGIKLLSAGSSGVYCGIGRKQQKLVVIKPYDENPYGVNNPKFKTWLKIKGLNFLKYFGLNLERKNLHRDQEYLAEVYASHIARIIGIDGRVPETILAMAHTVNFCGKEKLKMCSCQRWVTISEDDRKNAPEVQAPSWDLKWLFGLGFWLGVFYRSSQSTVKINADAQRDKDEFDALAMFDFLIGNGDRDTDNWLINGERVLLFDHGLALPKSHPTSRGLATRKQYLWAKLTNAQRPFGAKAKKMINDLCTRNIAYLTEMPSKFFQSQDEKLAVAKPVTAADLFDNGEEKAKVENANVESQGRAMQDRLMVLQYIMERGRPISELANFMIQSDFDRLRKELSLETAGPPEFVPRADSGRGAVAGSTAATGRSVLTNPGLFSRADIMGS